MALVAASEEGNWVVRYKGEVRGARLSFFNKFIYLFIYLFRAELGLCCCARAFSSCSERGLLFIACADFSLWWLLLLRSRALGAWASVVVARGLSSCGAQA